MMNIYLSNEQGKLEEIHELKMAVGLISSPQQKVKFATLQNI